MLLHSERAVAGPGPADRSRARRQLGLLTPGLVLAAALLAGCDGGSDQAQAPAPPPAVTVVKVVEGDFRPSLSFTGRVEARDQVDLRARVEGFLEKRLFTEGQFVKTGDLLFVIEKGPYQAAVDQIKANIERAEATLKLADLEVQRQTTLVQRETGTQAKLDEATAKQGESRADVMAQKAALEKAQLDLGYTDIRAPIDGRIGRALYSVGNFVGPSSGTLATIVSQDPIYVSFPVTQREMLAIRERTGGDTGNATDAAIVHVKLADGSQYKEPGKINFIDVTVNQGTDTVQVRATFPNKDGILVPGQLVTVVAETAKPEPALMIPQQAQQVDQSGAFVLVVDADNKVQVRRIEVGPTRGTMLVVDKGLEAGERVITEGIQKVRPGQTVEPNEVQPVT